jgi:hypothetical protein
MVSPLEDIFPGLRGPGYQTTSPRDQIYNCIAWAAGVTDAWWWPTGDHPQIHGPQGVAREETVQAFRAAFASRGYTDCDSADLEPGQEKIALYAEASGCPTHAARQLPNGRWTSKLGEREDIEHELKPLEGDIYGLVVGYMKRPCPIPGSRGGGS